MSKDYLTVCLFHYDYSVSERKIFPNMTRVLFKEMPKMTKRMGIGVTVN